PHAIGVVRQLLALVHHQVALLVEGHRVPPEEQHLPAAADAFQRRRDEVGIDRVRMLALEAHQHGLARAVATAGHRQRAEDFGTDPRDVLQPPGPIEPVFDESRRGAHRTYRVRGARTDADLVEVERADGHGVPDMLGELPMIAPAPTPGPRAGATLRGY